MTVKVNGEHVRDSPFAVQVTQRATIEEATKSYLTLLAYKV